MSDTPTPETTYPTAQPASSWRRGIVWAIPLAAVLIVAYLGLQALANQGVTITLTTTSASGVRVDDTKVMVEGVEAGHVSKIKLNKDGHHVDLTLRMDTKSKADLTNHAQFWLVGVKPKLTDIDSVRAALAGAEIDMAPGVGGEPSRHFTALEDAPVVAPGTKGKAFVLIAKGLGPVKAGSDVFYHGQDIGKITSANFDGLDRFRMGIFIFAPYDDLIRPGVLMWAASPVQVSVTDKGLSTSFEPASAILSGGVEVEVPETAAKALPSPAGTTFTLYETRADAEAGPNGPGVPYSFVFPGPAGELFSGAAVRLAGFQVGQVKSASLQFDSDTGRVYTAATAVLYPNRLHVAGPAGATDPAVWRGPTDRMVQVLIAHGYRAKLTQSPALIGARIIALEPIKTAPAASLGHGDAPLFPSAPEGGDIDDLTSQASQLLTKVNAVPIEAIGQDVHQITHRLSALVSSPKVDDSLTHLDSTLAQVDQMVTQVKPQVGPLVTKLNTAADEISGMATAAKAVLSGDGASQDSSLTEAIKQLNDAARSVRSLADYLGRHPESLIKGKAKENPQ